MRKIVLFIVASLVGNPIANAQTPGPDPAAIQAEIKRLQESLPKPYPILTPAGDYIVVCTHGGNLVERWYDGYHSGYATMQLYHLGGRPRRCDPKTGQEVN